MKINKGTSVSLTDQGVKTAGAILRGGWFLERGGAVFERGGAAHDRCVDEAGVATGGTAVTLRFRRLRLRAVTTDGVYGADVPFGSGLTVLWADNTKGKSTCMQGMLYALGLERMLSPRLDSPSTRDDELLEYRRREAHQDNQSLIFRLKISNGERTRSSR